ncbi:MAG TPA: hypothetical protein VHE30_07900 [Polyangiaceae bacterium]|nr:hypothetical protein [Polyangiaceae bacterium]
MLTITVHFTGCIQDVQEFGSDDEHAFSRVAFDLEVNGTMHRDLHVVVKQTAGSDYATSPLEVGHVADYHGPFNHDAFQREVESYYRSLVGEGGMIAVGPGARVRMRDIQYIRSRTVTFEGDGGSSRGW